MLSELENRIFVLGNSGSGKSWLSGTLADCLGIKRVALDDICWEPGGFYKSRNEDDVVCELQELSYKHFKSRDEVNEFIESLGNSNDA